MKRREELTIWERAYLPEMHPKIWGYERSDFIEAKEVLMSRSITLARRGRDALMNDLVAAWREEKKKEEPAERRS